MKKQKLTQEEINRLNLERELKDCREHFIPDPNRFFTVNERVSWGGHKHVVIIESYDNGKYYKVLVDNTEFRITSWINLFKYKTIEEFSTIEIHTKIDHLNINFMQKDISSLFSYWYFFGVETETDYQRPYVWELSDKQALITSIFNNIEIGKFAFIFCGYNQNKMFEILDGKQRLDTIISFYEDKFQWNEKFYSDLHPRDRSHFESYSIVVAETREKMTQKDKYEYFLKLNTQGKPQNEAHLEHVKNLYLKSLS